MRRMTWAIWAALLAVTSTQASADASLDAKRRLYALGKAGAEYCPGIKTGLMAMGAIGYDLSDDTELARFQAEKQNWFDTFQKVGSRALACELLMRQYGPGAEFQMFWFK